MSDPVSPHSHQHLMLSLFCILGLIGSFIVISHFGFNLCFLVATDVENNFKYLFAIILFDEISLHVSCPFSNWVVCVFTVESSLCILDVSSLSTIRFVVYNSGL